MNCQECHDYIDAYVDNELDVAATILVKQHLRDCFGCQHLLEARKAVGALLDNPQVRFEAPDSLLGKIQSVLPASRSDIKQRSGSWFFMPWFTVPLALAATIAVMLGLVFLNQGGMFDRSHGNALAQDVISSHVRSLLATHFRCPLDRSAYGQTLVRRKA
jgi:anti-sigma factor RsiW